MITVNEALKIILSQAPKAATELRDVVDTAGFILAQDVMANRDQPPFNRVAMDGIAIKSVDGQIKAEYKIEGIAPAGHPQLTLQEKQNCIEVMTGAPLPLGCNCVIPYEQVEISEGKARPNIQSCKSMQNVHLEGIDYRCGEMLIPKGTPITSPVNAVIASQGLKQISVFAKPRITIISTGTELVELGREVLPHQIYMSNSYAIEHELRTIGQTRTQRVHISDDLAQTKSDISKYLEESDILILTGGVSKGKFDYVPDTLLELGVEKHFHKIKQRPGKPMWYGTKEKKQIFALPGNPVSCLTCLRRYVLPALAKAQTTNVPQHVGILAQDVNFDKNLTYFMPVKEKYLPNGAIELSPINTNGSGDFFSLALSDGFIELNADESHFKRGEAHPYFPWGRI